MVCMPMRYENRKKPLTNYGPEAERFVSDIIDLGYFGLRFPVRAVIIPFEGSEITKVDDTEEYKITSIPVFHSVPSVAYCFEEKDKWNLDDDKLDKMGIKRGPWLKKLKKDGELEWKDKKTGIPVTGYIDFDVNIEDHITIVDIKTSRFETPEKFSKSVYNEDLRYDLQIGSYLLGYHKKYYQFPDFIFIVIVKGVVPDAFVVHVPGNLAQAAKDEFEHLLTAFRYCMDNNLWRMGVDFWLFDTMPYHSLERPRWVKSKAINDK